VDRESVAAELYGLPLKDFTKTRNARAKEAREAGDRQLAKQIKGLQKPTTAAWLLNMLVRRQRDEIDEVLALGAQFREAQEDLEGDQLRELNRQRRQLTAAITRQASGLGRDLGHRVSDKIAAEVEETLRAAMVDSSAAAALGSGSLVDTFDATGLGPVDLSGVVAVPGVAPDDAQEKQPTTTKPPPDRRALRKAKHRVKETHEVLRRAEEQAEQAHRLGTEASGRLEDLKSDRRNLQEKLREVEREIPTAEREEKRANRQREKAERDEAAARRAAERAKARLEQLG
jgi:chromosome segregation ATPase